MKLLFVQGGTRIKRDTKGKLYTDGNFNLKVWKRYIDLTSEKMTVIFREDSQTFPVEEARKHLNVFDDSEINSIILPDMYRPKSYFFSISKRKLLKKEIDKAVNEHDCIIIRSLGNIYVDYAIESARKYNKPYLVEVTGVYWDNSWYHSLPGKVLAPQREISAKKAIKNAPYAVYVTERALQKRYPCDGVLLGCSDVELKESDCIVISNRLKRIEAKKEKIVLGTAGFVSLKTKGQHDVIKALGELKRQGINNYEYQLIGLGDDLFLKSVAKKYDVEDEVVFLGGKTHDEVFKWFDSLDIYIQPSYQEGLCRAIIEAMSRGCPVICSNAGGNDELIDANFIFHRGNVAEFKKCLKRMTQQQKKEQAQINYNRVSKYDKKRLDVIRSEFYKKFIEESVK
ncbi:MAG: glycosyltransferase family 4 protein [Lachnospiraceae bacterium]